MKVLLLAMMLQCPDGSPPPCAASRGPAAVTVAVLPFDNLSRDTTDAYLARGLTDEITTRLTQIARLTVTSAVVMRRYRGSDDPRRVAAAVRASRLVAGSVRRDRQRLRISVELLNARDGVSLWNQSYDQPDSMLLDLEARIARQVATAITGRLLPQEQATIARRPTRDNAAYDIFLRGRYALDQRTSRSVTQAIELFGRAQRADPAFAAPVAAQAYAYGILSGTLYDSTVVIPRDSLRRLFRETAQRAVRIDSMSPYGRIAMAGLTTGAERRAHAAAAVAAEPTNPDFLNFYAGTMFEVDSVQALALLRRAIDADPTRPVPMLSYGMHFMAHRQYAEALTWLDSAASLRPEAYYFYADRALARLHTGDTAGVRRDADEVRRRANPVTADVLLTLLAARRGDTAAVRSGAEAAAAAVARASCDQNFDCPFAAIALVAAGRDDDALALLARAIQPGNRWANGLLVLEEFDPVRNDPRFRRLVE